MGKCRLAALHSPRTEPTRCTEHYQTIYARQPGAIAALTAGLHFDQTLLSQIREQVEHQKSQQNPEEEKKAE